MGHTIAILNQKGGVGKTTTAINLAAYLAKAGKSVLLIDFDPQGNATSGLGLNKMQLDTTMYEVLFGHAKTSDAVKETNLANVFILPSNANLAAAEVELAQLPDREGRLKQALEATIYDFVLIDCPPALGLLTVNALTAADYVLIPVQAEYYALEGLSQLLSVMERVQHGSNPNLALLGVVLTMYDSRTSLAEQVKTELSKHFADKVFATAIPRNVRLAEAPSFGQSILEHDKWSKGARAYKQLTKELIQKVKV